MLKVISFKICPFVQRVTATLEAKQIPYEVVYIDLNSKPQWFLDISPNGQVPLLITESTTPLFESDAIIEYIEDEYGPLQQNLTNEHRALERAWSYLGSKHYLMQCSAMTSPDQITLTQRIQKLSHAFAKAEAQFKAGPLFNGDSLSRVDLAWLPLLHRAHIIQSHTCFDMLEGFPKMKKWQQALITTGLTDRSVSKDFVENFTSFYLSNKTYLGRGADCPAHSTGGCDCC
ncbi:glutathione S-transferase family protein [Dongshaea marina]|uniref:glutathione S-transferase family protein n=1 Tax=Dongshaea marina TaxID=2047966 RepID=UPI000D3E41AC|nr:glutathione S-transferase family protein [Dongshaea marina]